MFRILDQGVLSRHRGRGAFIPTITPLSDGTFIAAQDVGSDLTARDHVVELLRSEDGRSWQSDGFLRFSRSHAPRGNAPPTLRVDGILVRG